MQTQTEEQRKAELSRAQRLKSIHDATGFIIGILSIVGSLFLLVAIIYGSVYVMYIFFEGFQQANQNLNNDWLFTLVTHHFTVVVIAFIVYLAIFAVDLFLRHRLKTLEHILALEPMTYTQEPHRSRESAVNSSQPRTKSNPTRPEPITTKQTLEERVLYLEKQVAELKSQGKRLSTPRRSWNERLQIANYASSTIVAAIAIITVILSIIAHFRH